MELEEVKQKVINRLRDDGWYPKLRLFLLSSEFEYIIGRLCMEVNEGKHWFPSLSSVFNGFSCCNPENYKGLIIDGYHFPFIEEKHSWCPTLNCISYRELGHKGILTLQTRLTNGRSSLNHERLWEPFIRFIVYNTNPKYVLNSSDMKLSGDNIINKRSSINSVSELLEMLSEPAQDQ